MILIFFKQTVFWKLAYIDIFNKNKPPPNYVSLSNNLNLKC